MAEIIDTATLDLSRYNSDETYWLYNGFDCCITDEVFTTLSSIVDDTCRKTYEFSKALQAPVLEMNMRGILVNKRRKAKVVREMTGKLAQLEEQLNTIIRDGVGVAQCNWRSPKDLKGLLYDTMGLPVQKKRNTNGVWAPTTDEAALEKLLNYFIAEPICNHILALRGLGKSLGFLATNIDNDGRMRTQFSIAGTVTGRFASSITDFGTGTNLQNVTESLRSVFVADPGYKFCNLDLEQGDSRNVGALCWNYLVEERGERFAGAYLDACESGDLHTLVTKMVYGDKLPWGTASDREVAEAIAYRHYDWRFLSKKSGHGSNYLMQPPTMAKNARCSIPMAKEFQEKYFKAFPCIPEWHKKVFWDIEHLGFVESPYFNRRSFVFGRPKEAATRREAVARVPQSMTGDEINTGILNLWRANRVQLLIQVHDSILFQYPEELEDEIVPWALEALKTRFTLARGREFVVPTEAKVGWNWGNYEENDNADGLMKWKGHDTRKRTETAFQLSLRDI